MGTLTAPVSKKSIRVISLSHPPVFDSVITFGSQSCEGERRNSGSRREILIDKSRKQFPRNQSRVTLDWLDNWTWRINQSPRPRRLESFSIHLAFDISLLLSTSFELIKLSRCYQRKIVAKLFSKRIGSRLPASYFLQKSDLIFNLLSQY